MKGKDGKKGLGMVVVAAVVVAIALAVVSYAGLTPKSGGNDNEPEAVGPNPSGPEAAEKGRADAPVTLLFYSDFQCPYCADASKVMKQVEDTYVREGKVRLVYRHFPFIGKESVQASEAAECAAEQGRFWAYHDKLFNSQAGENEGAFNPNKLKKFAADMKLDAEKFNACLDTEKHRKKILDQWQEGRNKGVRATPTFFINDRKQEGGLPFEDFSLLIDEALAAQP